MNIDDTTAVGKRAKVLRIHESEFGHGFQVVGGFRLVPFSQGVGFHADAFGWRLRVSVRRRPFGQWLRPRWYNYHFRWRGQNAPWEYAELSLGIFRVTFGPAYGGHLAW